MKTNIFYLVLVMLLCVGVNSLNASSVATTDDYRAAIVNPAALSYGNASGIAFEGLSGERQLNENYKVYGNSENFSFVYGKNGEVKEYQLAISSRLFRNFYLGGGANWLNKEYDDAKYNAAVLFRPTNMLSFGANMRDINDVPKTQIGVGFRPYPEKLKFFDKFELTVDTDISGKSKIDKPTIGVGTEIVSGIGVNSEYSLENKNYSLSILFAYGKLRTGVRNDFDSKNTLGDSEYHVFLSDRLLPSIKMPSKPKMIWYKKKLEVVDEKEQIKFGPFAIIKKQTTIREMISEIERLKNDNNVGGIVFINPELVLNYANLIELEKALNEFKEAGKQIVVYGDYYGNLHYAFFASIADKLYLNRNGSVNLVGFSIAVPYLADMFDKLGIDIVDLKSHDYKTGLNIFTQNKMTDQERNKYEEILELYYSTMGEMLVKRRGNKIGSSLDELINNGPYLNAEKALEIGLVDKLIYEEQLENELKREFGMKIASKPSNSETTKRYWAEKKTTNIAYINAVGDIVHGDGVPGKRIGSKTLSEQIKKARENSSISGIVLRIDSGGGSAFASDIIAQEVKKCREVGKPVVVSMGSMAASGGYYIAAHADEIVAEEVTLTGSIGVTGMIPNMNRMFDKLAIRWGSVKKGKNSELLAFYKPLEDREIEVLKKSTQHVYDQFVNEVAAGRKMSYEEVHKIAQGQIWTGKKAKELRLVDRIGGLNVAEESMKELVKSKEIKYVDYSYSFNKIPLSLLEESLLKIHGGITLPKELQSLKELKERYELWENESSLMLMDGFIIDGVK